MTCIVGFARGGHVWIGGDSLAIGGYNKTIRQDPKVFKRQNFIMGFTSSYRMGQLLQYDERLVVRPQKKSEEDLQYLVTAFIPAIQELFTAGGYMKVENQEVIGGVFLLGYKGCIYKVDSDFQIARPTEEYVACGSGEDFALGALWTLRDSELKPVERIIKALQASQANCSSVGEPFKIVEL